MAARKRLVVAVFVFEGIHPFLLTFPMRIFRDANGLAQDVDMELRMFAITPGRIRLDAIDPLELEVRHGLEVLENANLVVIPSWPDIEAAIPERLAAGIRNAHARGARLVGLCRGVFALAKAGLLDGVGATTINEHAEAFLQRFPRVCLNRDLLYVTDHNITTSAGRVAGLDCCLALVEEFFGMKVADQIADLIVAGPIRYGDHAQSNPQRTPIPEADRRILQSMDWAKSRPRELHHIEELAGRANMSTRTFTRRFQKLVGTTPKQWLLGERLARVRTLLENSELSVDSIAAASGFESTAAMRKQFRATTGVSPSDYRLALRSEIHASHAGNHATERQCRRSRST